MILNRKTVAALAAVIALSAVIVLIALSHGRTITAGAAPEVSTVSTDAYHASAHAALGAFAAAYSADADLAARRAAAGTAANALLALIVPPGNTGAHLALVSALVSYRDAQDPAGAAAALARVNAVAASYSWLGVPQILE